MNRIDPDEEAREIVEKWWEIATFIGGKVQAQAALQSAISSTITRYAESLEVAKKALRLYAFSGSAGQTAAEAVTEIHSILSRADVPEMEEVELTSWAIVAPSGYIETTSANEDLQRSQVANENSPFYGYQVVKLTGPFQRPKAKPVVKSVGVTLHDDGWMYNDGKVKSISFPVKGTFIYPEPAK